MSSSVPGSEPSPVSVRPARHEEREIALGLLVGDVSDEERRQRVGDVLAMADTGGLSLEGLLLAEFGGAAVGAILAVVQPDRMAFAWPPGVSLAAEVAAGMASRSHRPGDAAFDLVTHVGGLLYDALGRWLDGTTARYSQILLEPGSAVDVELLGRHGYRHIADLELRQRWLKEPLPEFPGVAGIAHAFEESLAPRFAAVIEQSYVGSLDCPGFVGYRSGAEAMVSHRASGVFDPALWTLFEVDGRDAGVLLLTTHPEARAGELVYMGLVPEARGKGLGNGLIGAALTRTKDAGMERLCLCVDATNTYARAIYESAGIVAHGSRSVWLRWSNGAPPESNPHEEHSRESS